MKFFTLTQMFASAFAIWSTVTHAKSLRGLHQSRETSEGSIICRVTTVHTLLGEPSDQRSSGSAEYDACIPINDGVESHLLLPITLDADLRSQYEDRVETGQLLVSIPGAEIEGDELRIPEGSQIEVFEEVPARLRHLSYLERPATGVQTMLVVRVTTSDGISPAASLDQLREHLFGDGISLKTQYAACSNNQLTFVDGGGIEVTLDQPGSSFSRPGDLLSAAMTKVMEAKGVSDVSTLADKVFFCQPGVTGGWLAVSPVNHWRMNFNDGWCMSLSANIHEQGHNLGLIHSGRGDDVYADTSGYMGYGEITSNAPLKCFNAHKNWLLQWYKDRTVQVSSTSASKVNLAAFVDFASTTSEHAVVVNVDNAYFLQYNRAKGANVDTGLAANQVAIVTPVTTGTRLLATLDTSDSTFTVDNYSNGQSLVIEVCDKNSNNGVDTMVVSIGLGKSYCSDSSVSTVQSVSTSSSTSSTSSSSSSGSSSTSSGSSSSSSSLFDAVVAATCKSSGASCTSDSQCCGEAVCLGDSSSTRKCTSCLTLFDSCSSNTECCGGMKCSGGSCRAS